jgi:hypothetical protein
VFGKLLLGDDISTARSTTLPAATKGPGASGGGAAAGTGRASSSCGPRGSIVTAPGGTAGRPPGAAGPLRTLSAGRGRIGSAGVFDTPRGLSDEGVSEEQELAVELDSVKRERERLLEAIAHVKNSAGGGGPPRAACARR